MPDTAPAGHTGVGAHGLIDGVNGTLTERSLSRASTITPVKSWVKWRRVVGLLLLVVTVVLWTTSNFLASTIFADNTYGKPYFVTYINTSFFVIPLVPILLTKAYRNPEEFRQWRNNWRQNLQWQYTTLKQEEAGDGPMYTDSPSSSRQRRPSLGASQELLLGEPMEHSQSLSFKSVGADDAEPLPQLTLFEIGKLSLEFCIIWFAANYSVAACLEYTTVASSTILVSTSSVWTLIFGIIFGVETYTLRKLIAVLASLAGIVLISTVDLSGNNSDDEHRGDFPSKSLRELAIGDSLALLSAVMYGGYAVLMKKRISDESRISMPIFFGFVGLINVVLLWPGLVILHFTGVERFELPPSSWITTIIMCNSAASLVADLAWAYAVLLTSPIVVTVGLSMAIPLSLVGQVLINSQTTSPVYWVGAILVVMSFVFVSQEEKPEPSALPDATGPGNHGG